jgi:outer membrane protein
MRDCRLAQSHFVLTRVVYWFGASLLLAVVSGLFASALFVSPVAQAAEKAKVSVAMVDMQAAILQTEEGKAAKVKIEKDAQTKRDALIKQQEDLNALGQEFQAQQAVLSEESKLEKQKEIQGKMQALRNSQMTFEQDVRRKEMEETQKIIEVLQKIIDEVSRQKGFEFVFERGSGALLYASSVTDITGDVVKIYNDRSKQKGSKNKDSKGASSSPQPDSEQKK